MSDAASRFMIRGSLLIGLLLALTLPAHLEVSAQDRGQDAFRPLTQAMLNDPDPSDWLMWRGGYANWGYSPLDQITPDNVNELRLAWSWAFAPAGPGSTGMQVEPIVYDVDAVFGTVWESGSRGLYIGVASCSCDPLPPIRRSVVRRHRGLHGSLIPR